MRGDFQAVIEVSRRTAQAHTNCRQPITNRTGKGRQRRRLHRLRHDLLHHSLDSGLVPMIEKQQTARPEIYLRFVDPVFRRKFFC